MKRFLTIVAIAVLALSIGACGSKNKNQQAPTPKQQAPTPKQQAEQFVQDIFEALEDNEYSQLNKIGTEMGEYINTLTEEQGEEFGEEFATKLYEYSDKYGYGEEFADEFIQAMVTALAASDDIYTE